MPFPQPYHPYHTPDSSCSCSYSYSSSPPDTPLFTPASSTLSIPSIIHPRGPKRQQRRKLGSTTILAALRLRLSREPHPDSSTGNMGQAQTKPVGQPPCAAHPAFAYPLSGEVSPHRMPGGMDDMADPIPSSDFHPPASAPPALGSASGFKTVKSRSIGRKLSTKRPHATISHPTAPAPAPIPAHRAKAARTLGEEMAAFEKLVHQAELAAGIEPTAADTNEGKRASRLRMSLPPTPPKVRPVTSTTTLAIPPALASASAIPPRLRSSSGLHRRSSTFSTKSNGVSPNASRRAEREWRAKVAALASASTSLARPPSRSSIIVSPPLRGPVPPRRPFPAAVPSTPMMMRSTSVDSHDSHDDNSDLPITPTAPHTPLMTVPLKHDRTHSSSRSFASRRSFETLGHHAGPGLGSCFPTPSPVGEARHTRQASVPQSISSYYLGVTSRPPSVAAASLLGRLEHSPPSLSPTMLGLPQPESPTMEVDESQDEGNEHNARDPVEVAMLPRLPTLVATSPLFLPHVISPTPPASLNEPSTDIARPPSTEIPIDTEFSSPKTAATVAPVIAHTPVRPTFEVKSQRQPADSPSVYSQRSTSTRRTRSMPSPPHPSSSTCNPALTPRRKPTHGLTLDFVRTPLPSLSHSRTRHLVSGSPGTPTYSPTTAYILRAPIENVWANSMGFADSPPRPDAHGNAHGNGHPYASAPWGLSGATSPPVKSTKSQMDGPTPPPKSKHKAAGGQQGKGKERLPLTPAPLQQQQQQQQELPSEINIRGDDPFLISLSHSPWTPQGSKALREVNLTPGMDTGNRPPKSGLPMDDLERWLATTSITV